MTLSGCIRNGSIELDQPVSLGEGTRVQVEITVTAPPADRSMPYRGAQPYRFDDPFTPAIPESEWDAAR